MILSDFNAYLKIRVIKTMFYWHKDTYLDQWNKTVQSPEINYYIYDQWDFGLGANILQGEKNNLFNKQFWDNYNRYPQAKD